MKNSELKAVCYSMAKKHSSVDWGWKITQTKNKVRIYWGYLDGDCWEIIQEDGFFIVHDEHGDFMNCEIEDDTTLTRAIQSAVYYMVTRY